MIEYVRDCGCVCLTLYKPLPALSQVRYRREHLTGHLFPHLAVMEDLMKGVCDGAALLAVIHFYCPEYMRLDGI